MSNEEFAKVVSRFLEKKILLAPELKEEAVLLSDVSAMDNSIFYLTREIFEQLQNKGKEGEKEILLLEEKPKIPAGNVHAENCGTVKIITSYPEVSSKKEVLDFSMYFNSRLEQLQKILYGRDELKSMTSISRILKKEQKESVSVIGIVKDKQVTKNKNIILTLEDSTGTINVLANKTKDEIYRVAQDIVLDEVVGISGVCGDNIIFANNILLPDIPAVNSLKKSAKEEYAIFLSDMHVGSNNFLDDDFERFLNWINQKAGNEKQKEIASKVRYIFIVGDLVDGVGIYPGQEKELVIPDIYSQYKECTRLISQIPKNISIIICAGNHDALRIAEPQPILPVEFCRELHEMPNAILVSNPGVVNIGADEKSEGLNVLLYHGYSFDHYVANVDSIRNNGGYDRADLIMKFLLKGRHLAPTHTSTLYVPYRNKDPLVIDIVPDIFVTGHIHKSSLTNYRNVTLICGSCWQSKTAFQEKVGHHPEPSRVPIVNLMTREAKILRFNK